MMRSTARLQTVAVALALAGAVAAGAMTAAALRSRPARRHVARAVPKVVLVVDVAVAARRLVDNDAADLECSLGPVVDELARLVDRNPELKVGLSLVSASKVETVPIAAASAGGIRARLDGMRACLTRGGRAAPADALWRAARLFEDSPGAEARSVIFVSDGAYGGDGIAAARAAAGRLWQLGATIYTIQITDARVAPPWAHRALIRLSGPPDRPGDAAFSVAVRSPEDLRRVFERIAWTSAEVAL